MNYNLSDDTWDKKEIEAISRVIHSNRFTMGPEVISFERKFADYFNSKFAVMVNSGSSANLLAIAALVYSGKLRAGDEVIVPAVSWSTTYYPLHQYNLKLKFIDIDLDNLNIDIKQLEKAVSNRTKAIFAVNLLGNPNNYDFLIDFCDKNNLLLIEDNCEALGAKFDNKYCGTFGIIGTYSTFYSHHICTMEGGIALTDNEELYHYMLSLRAHGWTRELPENSTIYKKSKDQFYESYNFIIPGYNVRPLEIEAAIGIEQIDKIDTIIKNRRENANIFAKIIKSHDDISMQEEIGESSWFGFALVLKNNLQGKRELVVERLISHGIEVRPIVAGNFTRQKVISYMDYEIVGKLENADYIHENGFFVGNRMTQMNEEFDLLQEALKL